MAGIDKTYVSNYQDWKEITDYMKNAEFTCPNGIVLKGIDDLLYPDMSKDEVESWLSEQESIPVMSTSNSMDYFLIKNCPIKCIHDKIKGVYSKRYYDSILNGNSNYDTFVRPEVGKHVRIIKRPKYNKLYKYKRFGKYHKQHGYTLDFMFDNMVVKYNKDFNIFVFPDELGKGGAYIKTECKTLKSLIRKVRKLNIPVGTHIIFEGMYIGEDGEMIVTK